MLAAESLGRLSQKARIVGNLDHGTKIVWGSKVSLIDVESEEISFGLLRFHVLDSGDALELNSGLQNDMACGASSERNQCALLAMAAGVEWSLQKRPHRAPARSRVQFVAREIRGEELAMARQLAEPMPRVLMSAVHDVVSLGRDRDIRVPNWFIVPIIQGYVQCEIRVVEISRNQMISMVHVSPCAGPTAEPLFFVAPQGHLRWMMPTMYSRPKEWKLRRNSFRQVVDQTSEDCFAFKIRYNEVELPPYKKCLHCPSWLKVDINDWCVGALQTEPVPAVQSQLTSRAPNRIPRVINGVEVSPLLAFAHPCHADCL